MPSWPGVNIRHIPGRGGEREVAGESMASGTAGLAIGSLMWHQAQSGEEILYDSRHIGAREGHGVLNWDPRISSHVASGQGLSWH